MVFPLEAPFSSGISQPRLIFRMGMQSGRPNDNWLVVWNMFFFKFFHSVGTNHPNRRSPSFFRGGIPPTRYNNYIVLY